MFCIDGKLSNILVYAACLLPLVGQENIGSLPRQGTRKIKLQDIIEKDGQPSSEVFETLISAPTTDANSEFHSLTSTHAPNDNEMMNNDDINEDMQDFEDEE
ncbi:hypothetical protein P8452_77117 [Trifolium repens]|nr:hypothetical protein P8452_77117 [Trifolium repens]